MPQSDAFCVFARTKLETRSIGKTHLDKFGKKKSRLALLPKNSNKSSTIGTVVNHFSLAHLHKRKQCTLQKSCALPFRLYTKQEIKVSHFPHPLSHSLAFTRDARDASPPRRARPSLPRRVYLFPVFLVFFFFLGNDSEIVISPPSLVTTRLRAARFLLLLTPAPFYRVHEKVYSSRVSRGGVATVGRSIAPRDARGKKK